jgi:N-hydroxyarylamine O-acetyltransferase
VISPATADAMLARLGFDAAPAPELGGLAAVYEAWCRTVPFDNLVKRIHLATRDPAPFPNADPQGFFDSFLAHGTGGTCWPSSLALFALLRALGFDARLASGAMADHLSGPVHTHGTIIVRVDDEQYWVDSSMLTDRPVPLAAGRATALAHPFRPIRVEPVDDLWRVWWRPSGSDGELGCLLLDDDVTVEHYHARYEVSREHSIFNRQIYATTNRAGVVLGIHLGQRWQTDEHGARAAPLDDRTRVLVEEFGYSEEIVAQLPADEPSP